jgi:hypothetical protein
LLQRVRSDLPRFALNDLVEPICDFHAASYNTRKPA